jgi:hypothetical protein
VLYIASGKRSILIALYPATSASGAEFKIHNVLRFDANGSKDDGSTYSSVGSSLDSEVTAGNINDYLQILLYLQGTGSGNLYSGITSNDYMLKTQVVPPVCPTCPSCPSYDGVCASCGGKGGSGTQGSKGSGGSEGDEPGLGRIIYDSGSGTKDLLEKTGGGATDFARDVGEAGLGVAAVGAGLGVAGVQGAVGLGREVVTGTVGLGREVVGGTIDLAKDAGRGVADAFGRIKPTQVSSTQFDNVSSGGSSGSGTAGSGTAGTRQSTTAGSDSLSYFGALPAKGGNYIPVTADFSRFGR